MVDNLRFFFFKFPKFNFCSKAQKCNKNKNRGSEVGNLIGPEHLLPTTVDNLGSFFAIYDMYSFKIFSNHGGQFWTIFSHL